MGIKEMWSGNRATFGEEGGIELCDEILNLLEELHLPLAAQTFRDSVEDNVLSIRENIESHDGNATEAMITALENMKAGIMRWVDHE